MTLDNNVLVAIACSVIALVGIVLSIHASHKAALNAVVAAVAPPKPTAPAVQPQSHSIPQVQTTPYLSAFTTTTTPYVPPRPRVDPESTHPGPTDAYSAADLLSKASTALQIAAHPEVSASPLQHIQDAGKAVANAAQKLAETASVHAQALPVHPSAEADPAYQAWTKGTGKPEQHGG
jgi:hypothetical protein